MLPPIGSKVKVIKPVFEGQNDKFSRINQVGIVLQYSMHGMVCVHFPDMPEGKCTFINVGNLQLNQEDFPCSNTSSTLPLN